MTYDCCILLFTVEAVLTGEIFNFKWLKVSLSSFTKISRSLKISSLLIIDVETEDSEDSWQLELGANKHSKIAINLCIVDDQETCLASYFKVSPLSYQYISKWEVNR